MRLSTKAKGVTLGVICAALVALFASYGVIAMFAGDIFDGLMAVGCSLMFLVGAIGGLLGADRLPDKSIAQLVETPVNRLFRR